MLAFRLFPQAKKEKRRLRRDVFLSGKGRTMRRVSRREIFYFRNSVSFWTSLERLILRSDEKLVDHLRKTFFFLAYAKLFITRSSGSLQSRLLTRVNFSTCYRTKVVLSEGYLRKYCFISLKEPDMRFWGGLLFKYERSRR